MSNNQRKTILITGGAGFIGSHLCEKYLHEEHYVICLDNLRTTVTSKNIKHLLKNKNFRFIKHDIIKPIKINKKIDWIFNFACSGSPDIYQYDPIHTTRTNTEGVINMLELAKKNNARIMQASTSEVYGNPLEPLQKESYLGNVNTIGPRACYDEGKRCAETLFMDYYREYGVDIKIIRIFNTYGPNMDPNDGRAMTNFIIQALNNKDIVIYGDGSNTRSFQYIDDLVSGIDKMMKKENFTGPVNLGNPNEITIYEIAKIIKQELGSNSNIIFKEKVTDDPERRCPDISLAKEKLDWEPEIFVKQGIKKTAEYFKKINQPDKKILIFATTYYPDLGPAEKVIFDLSKLVPNTEFHIVTTRFKRNLPVYQKINTDSIYRVGMGTSFDKYLLPFLGTIKAHKLNKKYNYKFAWSIMASYGGLTAFLFKILNKDVNFLLTFDKSEIKSKKFLKSKIVYPIYKMISKKADSVYLSGISLEESMRFLNQNVEAVIIPPENKDFAKHVQRNYVNLINKQYKKLARPK